MLIAKSGLRPDEIATRVEAAFDQIMIVIFKRTDRMFAYLMVGQWVFGILVALVFSPYTWAGRTYTTNIHVYTAVFLGGAISSLPIALTLLKPGSAITRYTV